MRRWETGCGLSKIGRDDISPNLSKIQSNLRQCFLSWSIDNLMYKLFLIITIIKVNHIVVHIGFCLNYLVEISAKNKLWHPISTNPANLNHSTRMFSKDPGCKWIKVVILFRNSSWGTTPSLRSILHTSNTLSKSKSLEPGKPPGFLDFSIDLLRCYAGCNIERLESWS